MEQEAFKSLYALPMLITIAHSLSKKSSRSLSRQRLGETVLPFNHSQVPTFFIPMKKLGSFFWRMAVTVAMAVLVFAVARSDWCPLQSLRATFHSKGVTENA